jgi:hypothetical protein
MAERLLFPSRVLLYGRVVVDLQIAAQAGIPEGVPLTGVNLFLQQQLAAAGASIARIYGFSYEGHYYDLAKPALFVVHGAGVAAERPVPGPVGPGGVAGPPSRVARAPDETDRTGVAATPRSFSEDMMVWAYDKGDFSIRMDVESGTFEQILLDTELSADRIKIQYSGQKARLRGDRGPGYED